MTEMVRLDRLAKRFGPVHAVEEVSFTVARGEVLGFLGPNGAGKSTTMRMLTGFLPPTAGSASVLGFDVVRQPIEVKRRVGYLPEGAPLYGDMTVIDFLRFEAAMAASILAWPSSPWRPRIAATKRRKSITVMSP